MISFYVVIFGFFISVSFPKYLEAGVAAFEESVTLIKGEDNHLGKKDARLGLGKESMQNLIINNIWFGTGFNDKWRGSGDKEGYETSDYPFLSAIAMMGIFGILTFLPIYIILVRAVFFDVKYLKMNKINIQSFEFFIFIFFIIYFILDLLQYMNWFLPVSLSRSSKWYIFLAIYMASREIFYKNNLKKKFITQNI